MAYTVKTEQFEGPLDLLLDLIRKEKLEITSISISKVTDQFIVFVDQQTAIDAELLSDFLVVAAKLLYIKSRALLPVVAAEDIEEVAIEELEYRLHEYNRFKEISEIISKKYHDQQIIFGKIFVNKSVYEYCPGENVTKENLVSIFKNLVSYLDSQEIKKNARIAKSVTIAEKIYQIKSLLAGNNKTRFSSLFNQSCSRSDVIVTFLALLELVKKQDVIVVQEGLCSELIIENTLVI